MPNPAVSSLASGTHAPLSDFSCSPATCRAHGLSWAGSTQYRQFSWSESSTSWGLPCILNLTLLTSSNGIWERLRREYDQTPPGLIGFFQEPRWKHPLPHNSCVLRACKVDTTWTLLSGSPAGSRWSLPPVCHSCCGLWWPRWPVGAGLHWEESALFRRSSQVLSF